MDLKSIKNDIIFPSDWAKLPSKRTNEIYLIEVFKKAIEMGIYDNENIDRSWIYFYGALELVSYISCQVECNEQLKLITLQLHVQYLIDDYLDGDNISDEISIKKINDIEDIILTGKVKNENSPLDLYILYYRDQILQYSKKVNKPHLFNFTFKYFLEWLKSIIPFNKLSDNSHFELFSFIRTVNIGFLTNLSLNWFGNQYNNDSFSIWNNLIFKKMIESISMVISIINDIASYSKEKKNNNLKFNYVFIHQKRNNSTFNDSYIYCLNKLNEYINSFQLNKQRLLNSININDGQEINISQNLLIKSIKDFEIIVLGYMEYCLNSFRYKCSESQFKELLIQNNDYKNESYNLILKKLYNQ